MEDFVKIELFRVDIQLFTFSFYSDKIINARIWEHGINKRRESMAIDQFAIRRATNKVVSTKE